MIGLVILASIVLEELKVIADRRTKGQTDKERQTDGQMDGRQTVTHNPLFSSRKKNDKTPSKHRWPYMK